MWVAPNGIHPKWTQVLVKKTKKLEKGHFYDVDIIDALPYELIAQPSLQ